MQLFLALLLIPISSYGMEIDPVAEKLFVRDLRLASAVEFGHIAAAKECIKRGADVNDRVMDLSALALACCDMRCYEIAHLLLQQPDIDVRTRSEKGSTPLHLIFKEFAPLIETFTSDQRVELVRLLLQHGANINAKDRNGDTALHIALKESHLSRTSTSNAINLLVKAGSKMTINDLGETPLLIAVDSQYCPDFVSILLQSPYIDLKNVKTLLQKNLHSFHTELKDAVSSEIYTQNNEFLLMPQLKKLQATLERKITGKTLIACESELSTLIDETYNLTSLETNLKSNRPLNFFSTNFEESCKKFKKMRDIHIMLARYYKVHIWLERAQKLQKIPRLPLEIIKIIASHSTHVNKENE